MKFTTQQETFIEALDFVKPASTPGGLVSLEAVEGKGTVHVTAQSSAMTIRMTIKARVETAGSWGVPFYVLRDYLNTLNADTVDVSVDPKTGVVTLEQGRGKGTIKGQDYTLVVPSVGSPDFHLEGESLRQMAHAVGVATDPKDVRIVLTGVNWKVDEGVGEIEAAATDGFRLAVLKVPLTREPGRPKDPYTCLIPATSLKEVAQRYAAQGEVFVHVTARGVTFRVENTFIACQQIEDGMKFPDYQAVIPSPREFVTTAAVLADEVSRAIKTVKIFSRDSSNVCVLRARPQGDNYDAQLFITGLSEAGDAQRVVNGLAFVKGNPQDVGINALFLDDAAKAMPGQSLEIKLIGPTRPLQVGVSGSDRFTYVIMPMQTE